MAQLKTVIVGLGITGMSCVRYLNGSDELVVVDTRVDPPGLAQFRQEFPQVTVETGATQFDFRDFDRVLVSPGVALNDPILAGLPADVELISDIDLFCSAATAPIVAVTGTNGKSTVTSLVGHLLQQAGYCAVVGGNLGEAALGLLDSSADVYVLELSSFQLERMATQRFQAATILNISEDHLDRHGDMAAYVQAKQRIYRDCHMAVANRAEPDTWPTPSQPLTTFAEDVPEAGHWGVRKLAGKRLLAFGDTNIIASDELPIAGRHNELNVLAAMALAVVCGVEPAKLAPAVMTFTGLAHRCQRVRSLNGVEFINDSKATNVGATRAALLGLGETFAEPQIVLIAGGDGKGADFSNLDGAVKRFVKALVLFGQDAESMASVLADSVAVHRVDDMSAAVAVAAALAQPGDLVLLSPACSSLDMYSSFAARGNDFAQAVEAMAA